MSNQPQAQDKGVLKPGKLNKPDQNAIMLTRQEVVALRYNKIINWHYQDEILALKYGNLALGGANALTNVAISSFYRDRFKLTKFSGIGLVSSVFLTGIFPSITTSIFTQLYFTENLLAFDNSECALCREIKTLAGFFVIGNLIPTGLSWITNFYQASALNTIKIPNTDFFIKNYKEKRNRVFYYDGMKKLFRETNIKMSGILLFNYSLQIILCSALMFFQRKQFTEKIEPSSFTIAEIKKIKN